MGTEPSSPDTLGPQDSPDLKSRILGEATRLFAIQGYGSTSVRQVVEAVGCTKPALYYYFGSKEVLFRETIRTHMAAFGKIVQDACACGTTLRQQLSCFIEAFLRSVLDNPHVLRLLMTAQHPTSRQQPKIDMLSLHRQNGEVLKSLFREGVGRGEIRADLDLDDLVLAFIGMTNIRVMIALLEDHRPDDLPGRLLDIFFNGAGSSSKGESR